MLPSKILNFWQKRHFYLFFVALKRGILDWKSKKMNCLTLMD